MIPQKEDSLLWVILDHQAHEAKMIFDWYLEHRHTGQREDSRPRQNKRGELGISSCYSEWHTT
jgi:hypothetical protein